MELHRLAHLEVLPVVHRILESDPGANINLNSREQSERGTVGRRTVERLSRRSNSTSTPSSRSAIIRAGLPPSSTTIRVDTTPQTRMVSII